MNDHLFLRRKSGLKKLVCTQVNMKVYACKSNFISNLIIEYDSELRKVFRILKKKFSLEKKSC